MSTMNFSQTDGLFHPGLAQSVTLIGVGSVGSQIAVMLPRIGVTDLTLYDPDSVESHNTPMTPVFGIGDLGRYKVDVVAEEIFRKTGVRAKVVRKKYAGEPFPAGVVIACVDNMSARAQLWEQVRGNPNILLWVDTRMHEFLGELFFLRPKRHEDDACYEKYLFKDERALRATCGEHGIVSVTSNMASRVIHGLTIAWRGGIPHPHESVLLGDTGTYVVRNPWT